MMSSSWNAPAGSATKSASDTKASKEMEPIDQLFYSYADESSGMIEPKGLVNLFSDLKIDHPGTWLLLLSGRMQAKKKGYLNLEEWHRGLKAMGVNTIDQLRHTLPSLWSAVSRPRNFQDLYTYAFKFLEKQKTIDAETICKMLSNILQPTFRPQVDALTQYLRIQTDYFVITMDQWMGFYRFCTEINFPDLNNYDPNHSWPVILDNFLEWLKSKQD